MEPANYNFDPRIRRKHVPLVTQQHRLRHLCGVLARNITIDKVSSNNSVGFYYTLHLKMDGEAIYTSETIYNTMNPSWKRFEYSNFSVPVSLSVSAVVTRVWCKKEDVQPLCVMEWVVHFSGLLYLSEQVPKDGRNFQPNSLLFVMSEGIYGTNDSLMQAFKTEEKLCPSQVLYAEPSTVHSSYSVNDLNRMQTTERAIKQTQAQVLRVRKAIEEKLEKQLLVQGTLSEREKIRLRVTMLQEELQERQKGLKELQNFRNRQNDEVTEKKKELAEMVEDLKRLRNDLVEKRRHYFEMREDLLKTNSKLLLRRKQLISELSFIYPVVQFPNNKGLSICSVHLPNSEDFLGHSDVMISVALGYVTHMLLMISHFFDVPLRYPLKHFGSNSSIVDNLLDKFTDKEREFPLYTKGKEKVLFNYGVYLLNKNIAQLRCYSGLPTTDLRATLPNLFGIIEHFSVRNDLSQSTLTGQMLNRPVPLNHSNKQVIDTADGIIAPSESNHGPKTASSLGSSASGHVSDNDMILMLKKEMDDMVSDGTVDTPTNCKGHFNCTATQSVLSGSLDKGLNEIKVIEKSLENVPNSNHTKSRQRLQSLTRDGIHSSVPNLTACAADSASSGKDAVELEINKQTLKVWSTPGDERNSEDEHCVVGSQSEARPTPSAELRKCDNVICDSSGIELGVDPLFDINLTVRTEHLASTSRSFCRQKTSGASD